MNELDLFAAAIAVADPADRASLLDRECAGRLDVRRRIDQLLDAHFRSQPLFDQPNPEVTVAYAPKGAYAPNEQAGAVIAGRYKLLEEIGEGGMGTVWVAEQTQPVRRKVALKLIKAGMDSKSVIARFEAERQALAVMDHPNVAKVLDGGLTETGRPFFVMEYVKGVPITEYCDATRLNVSERLHLFAQVCQAVQHAPSEGHYSPRSETLQHPGRALRRQAGAEDHRLWPGQGDAPITDRKDSAHRARFGPRHAAVHVSRTGTTQQPRRGHALGHLLARRSAVRTAHGDDAAGKEALQGSGVGRDQADHPRG